MAIVKLCECGCGGVPTLAVQNRVKHGYIKGQPQRFVFGHQPRRSGERHHNWKGGKKKRGTGYISVLQRGHLRACSQGYVLEHVLIAERALGCALPPQAEIHHFNEVRNDNRNCNLVICENHAYHHLLHVRRRALLAGAPAHWLKCWGCKTYDHPANLVHYSKGNVHRNCTNIPKHQKGAIP